MHERASDVRRAGRRGACPRRRPRTRKGSRLDSDDASYEVPDFTVAAAHRSRRRSSSAAGRPRDRRPFAPVGDAVPTATRQFSRTERLLLRFDAYGPAGTTPDVTLRAAEPDGRRRSRPCRRPRARARPSRSSSGSSPLPPGDYLVEIAADVRRPTRRAICSDSASPADAASHGPRPKGRVLACRPMLNAISDTPLGGLLAALSAFTAFYIVMWWSAVDQSDAARVVARARAPASSPISSTRSASARLRRRRRSSSSSRWCRIG